MELKDTLSMHIQEHNSQVFEIINQLLGTPVDKHPNTPPVLKNDLLEESINENSTVSRLMKELRKILNSLNGNDLKKINTFIALDTNTLCELIGSVLKDKSSPNVIFSRSKMPLPSLFTIKEIEKLNIRF